MFNDAEPGPGAKNQVPHDAEFTQPQQFSRYPPGAEDESQSSHSSTVPPVDTVQVANKKRMLPIEIPDSEDEGDELD